MKYLWRANSNVTPEQLYDVKDQYFPNENISISSYLREVRDGKLDLLF